VADARLKLTYSFIRCFFGTQQIHNGAVDSTDNYVNGRYKPWIREGVEDNLVLEVESHIESIPVAEEVEDCEVRKLIKN